ncbi:general secretion pathway protein GspF [Marinobacter confluentis]|uniref:General secretion pathway protein GspF n=1 Tax=Marinobacter confluentis TaxID=1697557 RepID=A0A4Z1CJ55_9GAMM|nr:general secretion pathway protein GspF [Marinobacter confluentis]TGN41382.1 general secretion pathway protein GspF [Marinobacter confluentis]
MLIKTQRKRALSLEEPLLHPDHARPKTRREFIAQGFMAGAATLSTAAMFNLLTPGRAMALSEDLENRKGDCNISTLTGGKVPFICFDLAGGANMVGSNVLMGKSGGQLDFLSTAGYNKLGLPGDMLPNQPQFVNQEFGLAFHSDSGFLRGMQDSTSIGARAFINGAVIAARSENDTGNNPHNPMYGILKAGADGQLLSLVGSQSSESGGNSMAPMSLINPKARPTKVDRPTDATGLVDVGDLTAILNQSDAVSVLESIRNISLDKINLATVNTGLPNDAEIKSQVDCSYIKSAYLIEEFGDPSTVDPALDTDIVGASGIFTDAEFFANNRQAREFRKTASVMKLVQNRYAGAGTVTLGGYDYHTGERATGEDRDYLAGRCMGACLEYAHRVGAPLMLYVFSDGSVSSNGRIDDSEGGRGKGEWTGDNQQTAASFYLVYNPTSRPVVRNQQIGYMRSDASVETASSPAANNVNQLVQTVVLNYMALNNEEGLFETTMAGHGLGGPSSRDRLVGIEPIV